MEERMKDKKVYDKIRYNNKREEILENSKSYYLNHKKEMKNKRHEYSQSIKGKFASYKAGAKQRGHLFDLSFEEFKSFWQVDCSYCGRSISTIGLDRVDSSIGYNVNNIVSCCSVCNFMKRDINKQDWLDILYTILKHQGVI